MFNYGGIRAPEGDGSSGASPVAGLTPELEKLLEDKAADIANRTFDARKARIEKELKKQHQDQMDALRAELTTSQKNASGSGKSRNRDDEGTSQTEIELNTLKQTLENLKRQNEDDRRELQRTQELRKRDTLRQNVTAQLHANGANPGLVTMALNHLLAEGLIAIDGDEGSYSMVFRDNGRDVDLGRGIAGWLKTDPMGKQIMPVKATSGSGSRATSLTGDRPLSKTERDQIFAEAAFEALRSGR